MQEMCVQCTLCTLCTYAQETACNRTEEKLTDRERERAGEENGKER